MLYVHCTARLAKAARTPLQQAPQARAPHWLDCWYANLAQVNKSSNVILFSNALTLYSILIPQPGESFVFFGMIAQFTKRLEDRLASLNINENAIAAVTRRHAEYAICKTASRQVLGSMNEMIFHLRWMVEEQPDIAFETFEDVLNELPSKVLGYSVPLEKFEERIRLAN